MAGQVNVDTALMQTTAQQSSSKADTMITQAKTLRTGIDFVSQRWQGAAGDAFRNAMRDQGTMLDQLIQRLQFVSDTIKRGGQGLDSHDQTGRQKLTTQGGNFLNGNL